MDAALACKSENTLGSLADDFDETVASDLIFNLQQTERKLGNRFLVRARLNQVAAHTS